MIAVPPRAMRTPRQRQVSQAPSAVTKPIWVPMHLAQQVWQDGTVACTARGELYRADVGYVGVHGQMGLAPLASPVNTMLLGLQLAIAEELDNSSVHQQVQWPFGTAVQALHLKGFLPAARRRVIRNAPVQFAKRTRLATILAVWLNCALIDKQNWRRHSKRPTGALGVPHSMRANLCPCPGRSATIDACGARRWRRIESSCGTGWS